MTKDISANINKKLLALPIDQFGRYYIVSSIIKELAESKKQNKVKILDIGGYKGSISNFFSKDFATVTIIDLYDSDDPNYVKGDALAMPFEDNSYDYVVSFEVFEHIPRPSREQFIKEALRVSKGPVILTAPFSGEHDEVLFSESLLNQFWKSLHKQNHQWLHEHITYSTPKTAELEAILKKQKKSYIKIGNNDLLFWNLMLSFNFITTLYRPSGRNAKVEEFYNRNLEVLESDTDYYYRYIYIIGDESKRKYKALNKQKTTKGQKQKLTYELINKVFTALAKDFDQAMQNKQAEILKLSKELEKRIQDHDSLVEELDKIHSSKSWKALQKSARIKSRILGKK